MGPLTFQALSGHPVLTDTLDPKGWQMAHLELPERASAMLIAPASANMLSKLAQGNASDIVSASVLAMPRAANGRLKTPVFVAPAMHEGMWFHPATQTNVRTLTRYGYQLIGPLRGPLGRVQEKGVGRLAEPPAIASAVLKAIAK